MWYSVRNEAKGWPAVLKTAAPTRAKAAAGRRHRLDFLSQSTRARAIATIAPRLGNFFWCFFRRRRRQIAAGADYGGAPPAHVLAPPRPPMMRAHQPALPLAIRAVP